MLAESTRDDVAESPITFAAKAAATSGVDTRRGEVAQMVGVSAAEVGAMIADLSLLKRGVFVDVDAVGTGMMAARRLDWETFGLEPPATSATRIGAPTATLVPDEYRLPILRVVDRGHQLLQELGYEVRHATILAGASSGYRWLPARAVPVFLARFGALVEDFARQRARLLDSYDAILARVADDIGAQACQAAARVRAAGGAVPEGFEGRVRDRFVATYPSRPDFAAMALERRVAAFFFGPEIERQVAEVEEIRRERRRAEDDARLARLAAELAVEQQRLSLWADEATVEERLAAERRKIAAEEEAERLAREINLRALREAARERVAPLIQIMTQDLDELAGMTAELIAHIGAHGHLPGVSRKRFLDFVALLRVRSVWLVEGDALDRQFADLERLITGAPRKKGGRRRKQAGVPTARERDKEETAQIAARMREGLSELHNLVVGEARAVLVADRMSSLEL